MFQLIALVAGVAAVPVQVDQYGAGPGAQYNNRPGPRPGPAYAPLPQGDQYAEPRKSFAKPIYVDEKEEEYDPQPYKYEYGVQDDYSKAAFAKSESQNEVGAVTGSYKVPSDFNFVWEIQFFHGTILGKSS